MNNNFKIFTDGGARGNPGPSGIGGVIKSPLGSVLVEISEYIGEATNNVAEYTAVLRTLEKAKELGIKNIQLYADSKLVVEQLSGRWKVKEPTLKELVKKILEIKFEAIMFNWIPRKENVHADQLANKAMDLKKNNVKDKCQTN